MTGMLALGGLFLAGLAFVSLMLAAVLFLLKSVLWLVLLPFRLLMWTVGAVLLFVGTAALVLAPLLPFVIFGALVYGIVRLIRRPAMA